MGGLSRIDKLLALTGIGRTEAKKLIASGRVCVKGVIIRDSGAKALLSDITLDGKPLDAEEEVYLMLNKPAGVVTATEDKHLPTVMDLLPAKYRTRKIGPIGRLDRDVTGLVIMTTNGEMAHRLISPKYKAEKCYRGLCEGRLEESHANAFSQGLELHDFTARPAVLNILRADDESSEAEVILTEGKFHQVKKMFLAIGHPLISLSRERIGSVTLDKTLEPGESRLLTDDEIRTLKQMTGLLTEAI